MFDFGWVGVVGGCCCVVCGGGWWYFFVVVGVVVFDDCCGIFECFCGVIGDCDCDWFVG